MSLDRTKAEQGGYTTRDVAQSMLNSLSGSFQITPMFYLNYKNGVNYNLVAQTPQYRMDYASGHSKHPDQLRHERTPATTPEVLGDLTSIRRDHEMAVVSHYNIRRVVDIYGAVQDRDLGAVAEDVEVIVHQHEKNLPRGMFVSVRGQVQTMRSSYVSLLGGLVFAIVLVYMLIVVNFQSWLDPFIIITALPAALAGIVLFLFLTHTTLSVPASDGRDHVHGRRDREQHPRRFLRQDPARGARRCDAGGDRSRRHTLSPGLHDRARDDHRHGADGAGTRRRRRAERAAGTRRNRRTALRDCCHTGLCAGGLQHASRSERSADAQWLREIANLNRCMGKSQGNENPTEIDRL